MKRRSPWSRAAFCLATGGAAAVLLWGWLALGESGRPERSAGALSALSRAAASAPRATDALRHRGVAIQISTSYRAVETYGALIAEVAELGADTVLLTCLGTMEHAKSQGIYIDHRKTPAPAEFHDLMATAQAHGLRVVLMPMLLLSHPRGSEWRGQLEPPSWDEWWKQYRQFIEHFADIAREGRADALIVGSELISTEKYTAQWVRIIEAARARFDGLLGYSANWDHYKTIQFWDKLDFIGMTTYNTLADRKLPTVSELVTRWRPIHAEVLAWRRTINRPILLTEVGWCSQEGAAMAPWNYYQNQKASPGGHEEQRRLYEAFLEVWGNSPGLLGMCWWEWTSGPGGAGDFGYTPRGKPAEEVLRRWLRAGKAGAADADTAGSAATPTGN